MKPAFTHPATDDCLRPSRSASFTCVPKNEMASCGVMAEDYRFGYILVNGHADTIPRYVHGMTIGNRIRARRKELKLPQVQLAKAIGISQGAVSDLETGETEAPAGETLVGLCRALHTTAKWIIHGTGDHVVSPPTEEEQAVLDLLRLMSPEQAATWIRLGRALLDDPPPRVYDEIPIRPS